MKVCHFPPTASQLVLPALSSVILLLAAFPVLGDDSLIGRLFFSAERRQQLDRQRDLNTLDKQQAAATPTLTVDGVVVRSSGHRTTWLNGSPQHENEMLNGLTLTGRAGEPARILVESNDAPATRARVGETVNRSTGETTDLLQGGQIRVGTSPEWRR